MPRLIVQADDIAITHGATLGILDGITNGIVRATGMFANCPDAAFAASRLRELDGIDVGIDLNFVTGRPVLPASEVPGLVTGDGAFRTSGQIRAEYRVTGGDAVFSQFEREPFDLDETMAEARAQVDRFVELMGRAPAYVHHHSIVSPVSDAVVRQVAADLGVLFVDDLYRGSVPLLPNDWYAKPFPLDAQITADAVGAMERLLPAILANETSLLILHPGYVDAEILGLSTFSIIRARDLELVASPAVRALLDDAGVEVTSFSDAGLA
ncbi:ChbG/HpnK family deacetylase [Microbacterium sp.]|uniref:ChbG/HpnK family deacetylase n=1 Tax=Microbacterium sp. TaxID=51671 RepID=UPI0039E47805